MIVLHFFNIFGAPGVGKSSQNDVGNGIQQQLGCKSVLERSWGGFWTQLGVILGPKIGPKRGPKTILILEGF